MRREALWDRLYLSGIDGRAAELARENGLGLSSYKLDEFW